MPLTAEQKAALTTAVKALDGATPEDIAAEFHTQAGKAAQVLIDQGDGAATKRAGADLRKAEKALETEQAAHLVTKGKLVENDPSKLHEKYATELRTKDEAHATEVKSLKEKGVEKDRGRDLANLRAKLAPRLKPMALEAVMNDPATARQLAYGEDGDRRVLQRGKDTAYAPSAGTDVLDLWADDLVAHVKGIDADSVLAPGAPGGGSGGGDGAPSGGYDPVKAGHDAATRQKQSVGQDSLAWK